MLRFTLIGRQHGSEVRWTLRTLDVLPELGDAPAETVAVIVEDGTAVIESVSGERQILRDTLYDVIERL